MSQAVSTGESAWQLVARYGARHQKSWHVGGRSGVCSQASWREGGIYQLYWPISMAIANKDLFLTELSRKIDPNIDILCISPIL